MAGYLEKLPLMPAFDNNSPEYFMRSACCSSLAIRMLLAFLKSTSQPVYFISPVNVKMKEAKMQNSQLTFDHMCRVYVRLFRFITILPFEGRNFNFIGTRLLTFYLFCSSLFNWSMFTIYCFTASTVQVEDICLSVLVIGVNYRYYMMIRKRKIFASMFNECRALWSFCTEQGQRTVMVFEKKMRRAYIVFVISCFFINVLYPVDALMTRLPPLEPNGTERRILPYNWFADNTEKLWPGYWPIFILQMLIVQNAIIYGMTCDASTPLLVMISSGYFRHLRDRLSTIHENPKVREREFMLCINFHQRLLSFCSKLAKYTQTMLLTQVLSTGYNISLILIKLVSSDRDKYKHVSIMCVFVCQLYLIQWAPDYLYDESEGVALSAYSASVESMENIRLGKYVLIVIMRAQRPMQFLAGGFIPLSLQAFGNMMKSAFSFFTLLRNLDW